MLVDIKAPVANLPRGQQFIVLVMGAEPHLTLRAGEAVTLKGTDAELEAKVDATSLAPMAAQVGANMTMHGMAQHYANHGRQADVRNVIDALEVMYPQSVKANAKALDGRTFYSSLTVTLPPVMPTYQAA